MTFDEFYKLLRQVLDKIDCSVQPSPENFNMFMANRYLSFYHPEMAKLVNETSNKLDVSLERPLGEPAFDYLCAVIPKVKSKFIKYIKKPAVENQRNKSISDDEIKEFAEYMELSTREIRNELLYSSELKPL